MNDVMHFQEQLLPEPEQPIAGSSKADTPALPLGAPSLAVFEEAFGLSINLDILAQISSEARDNIGVTDPQRFALMPVRFQAAIEREIRQLCRYKIRVTIDRGTRSVERIFPVDQSEYRRDERGHGTFLIFPKAAAIRVKQILQTYGIRADFIAANLPAPSELMDRNLLKLPFKDGSSLDDLQQSKVFEILEARQSGIVSYGMGGGKSFLVAGIARAYPTLRPLLITASKSTDTAQLAVALTRLLDEPVSLVGATGGITTGQRKALFVPWQQASIIVGTQQILQHLPQLAAPDIIPDAAEQYLDTLSLPGLVNCSTPARPTEGKDKGLADRLLQTQLFIADEVHDLPTRLNLSHLRTLNPKLFFGVTGTWMLRADRLDRVLGDLVSREGAGKTLASVRYSDVVATGRVVPVELHAYQFDEKMYPFHHADGRRRPITLLTQRTITLHDGRNRFAAELIKHLLGQQQPNATLMVSVKTIEHGECLLRHFSAISEQKYDLTLLRQQGILLHNAQLKHGTRLENVEQLKAGTIRCVITTDTLSTGFDCKFISDMLDVTGMKDTIRSLQRAGRPGRQSENKLSARIHFVFDTHHPALIRISQAKKEFLEHHFEAMTKVHPAHSLPWRGGPLRELTDDVILEELNR